MSAYFKNEVFCRAVFTTAKYQWFKLGILYKNGASIVEFHTSWDLNCWVFANNRSSTCRVHSTSVELHWRVSFHAVVTSVFEGFLFISVNNKNKLTKNSSTFLHTTLFLISKYIIFTVNTITNLKTLIFYSSCAYDAVALNWKKLSTNCKKKNCKNISVKRK